MKEEVKEDDEEKDEEGKEGGGGVPLEKITCTTRSVGVGCPRGEGDSATNYFGSFAEQNTHTHNQHTSCLSLDLLNASLLNHSSSSGGVLSGAVEPVS